MSCPHACTALPRNQLPTLARVVCMLLLTNPYQQIFSPKVCLWFVSRFSWWCVLCGF